MGRNAELFIAAAPRAFDCQWALKGCAVKCEEEEDWEDSEKMEGFSLLINVTGLNDPSSRKCNHNDSMATLRR